jgi:hypothetical protein
MQARSTSAGFVLVLALAGMLHGCPGSLADPEQFRFQIGGVPDAGPVAQGGAAGSGGIDRPLPLCPIDVPTAVLRPTCATPLCHDAAGAAISGGLRLDGSDPAAQLLGVAVVTESCREAGWELRVDPDDPQGGGLLVHLVSEATPTCSQRMPSGQPPLTAYELECLRRWLENTIYDRNRENGEHP